MQAVQRGLMAAGMGLAVNLMLAILKIVTGILGNSYALIADGIESTGDIVSSLVVWTGLKISALPADTNHPYGHGKAESIAGLVVGLALVGAAVFITVQSVREIITPHHAPAWFTLPVLALVIAAKETLFRYAFRVGDELASSSVRGDAWHHRSDALTSAAVFVGISVALVGGEGYEAADDWAALLACSVIAFNGWQVFRVALGEVMDAAVPGPVQQRVREVAGAVTGVVRIEKCRVRKSGLGLFVEVHIEVDGDLSVRRGHDIAHRVSDQLKGAALSVQYVMVHVEPADARPDGGARRPASGQPALDTRPVAPHSPARNMSNHSVTTAPPAGLVVPLNPALASLPVYQPGRPIEEVARELGLPVADIIKLASNENPLGPSPKALAAMRDALPQLQLYPDGNAFHLKRRLAEKLAVAPENLILGNGSNEVLELIGHAAIAPDVEVIVSQYCFAVYPIVTHLFRGTLVVVPARQHGHDLEAMQRAITPRTRVVFVANPNNPTGTLASSQAVLALIEAAPPSVLVVIDEAYLEYLDAPQDLLPWIRAGRRPNLVLTRTFSKIHGLAGLRIGYGIGHPDFISALEKIREPFNTNTLAQVGALAALDDEDHLRRARENNTAGLRFYEERFRALGLEFLPSAGNFILVRVGDGQRVFVELQQRGVIVRPMGGYRLPEWVRISVGTPAENERCVGALREVLGRG